MIVMLCVALTACKNDSDSSPTEPINRPGNILANPSFEIDIIKSDPKAWKWLDWSKHWGPFEISNTVSHSGKKSALLTFDVKPGNPSKKIKGVLQTLTPDTFPDVAGGWYRIENWNRGVKRQYLQFVVIAWEDFGEFTNYQLRYILEGVTMQPLNLMNAKYTIIPTSSVPKTGEWKYFELPIRDDYQKLWGKVPDKYKKIDFFWEARFDEEPKNASHIRADVYYDDLYIGSGK